MLGSERIEAQIVDTNNILVALSPLADPRLASDFLGPVIRAEAPSAPLPSLAGRTVYLCGDVSRAGALPLGGAARVLVIKERSHGYEDGPGAHPLVGLGRVPLRIGGGGGIGIFYRCFFTDEDLFGRVRAEHAFQSLTESVKPAKAHRTGIYLTPVRRKADGLHFHLLRCSTNLSGPTEGFCATDRAIVDALNREAAALFQSHATLNHVLAQIYANSQAAPGGRQTKAKISAHADKTKDMPPNGIMAFCTFYDRLDRLSLLSDDPFDYGHKGQSGLTRLHFRLKAPDPQGAALPAELTLTLYPNSVLFIPLSTNRLYTHEIRSSILDAERLPTRLGYVVRCSKTEAVHRDGRTFLKAGGGLAPLARPTPEGMSELRRMYAAENTTSDFIDYGDRFPFSMNEGDYLAPVGEGD